MSLETSLLSRARRLEEHALAEVYDAFSPGLYRYAMRLLGDSQLAEDCVAETFSRLLKAFHGGGGPRKHLKAYLYQMAHNWVTDYFRRRPPGADLASQEQLADPGVGTDWAVETHLEVERLRRALVQLTPGQRQVITLKFLEGWSNGEIASALDKPIGAVKALQHRGLAALQRLLAEEEVLT